ncbi:DoxX family membrane protein [Gemmatimonadota bacterium]
MAHESGMSETLKKYSGAQKFFLAFLRVIVGWHFLYEGYVKLSSDGWSAAGYLRAAPGPFGAMFESLVNSAAMVGFIDGFMAWGLTIVGIVLILGLFTRIGLVVAGLFLLMFYLSNPPWVGVQFMPGEGSYLIVNKNLIELAAVLVLLVFPSGAVWGFDKLFYKH